MVVVSDLHVGDQLAICAEQDDTDHPRTKPIRDWMRHHWHEFTTRFIPRVTQSKPFVLVVNGDMVQGNWSRFGPLLSKSMVTQCRMVANLLRPLVERAAHVIFVEGTEIHVGDDEQEVALALDAIAPGKLFKPESGGYVHQHARVQLNGLNHVYRHHTGIAGRAWTEAGNQANHLADDRLRRLRNGHTPTDILITAHRHTFGFTATACGMSIVTPSWQGLSRHVLKVNREDAPSVGGIVLDYSNCEWREKPHVRDFIRSWPESEALDLDRIQSAGAG